MADFRYSFAFTVGEKGMVIQGRALLDRTVLSLGLGTEGVLTLEPRKEKKTSRQVRAIFGPIYDQALEIICSSEGYRRDEWPHMKDLIHDGLAGKYQGYDICPITKKEVRKFRLSKATKQETTDFMNWLAQFMAEEYHVALEMPGDR